MIHQIIKEDLLHYVWKTKQIDLSDLKTVDGKEVEIKAFGIHNHDAGPDFSHGKVIIDGTQWVGNIEMHIRSSDWEKHSHDSDPAYDSVILHVVYDYDIPIYTTSEVEIPCIELRDRIKPALKNNYARLLQAETPIPCGHMLNRIDELTLTMWKDRLIAERLESKSQYIKGILTTTTYDWNETLYITLTRYMGSRVNTEAFESLALNLPHQILLKNADKLLSVEALLYGVGGMLEAGYKDSYFQSLQREYRFLAQKYTLTHIPPSMWKFSKMRPANFPTVRIAQLAAILCETPRLFSRILEAEDADAIFALLDGRASPYWDEHYRFDKKSISRAKNITPGFKALIAINVVAPILYLYGLEKDDSTYTDKAVRLLQSIKPEKNSIITKWNDLGIRVSSAMDTQAYIHLRKQYCDHRKCLSCSIGNKLVKPEK